MPDSLARSRTHSGIQISRRISSYHRHPVFSGLDAVAAPNVASPELRRCRSVVSISKFQASSSSLEEPPCDVVLDRGVAKVESKNAGENVGLSNATHTAIDSKREDQIRVSSGKLGESNSDIEDGEIKTIREYIDLEFQNKSSKSKDLSGNFLGAGSVFRKLRSWRNDNKIKNHKNGNGRKTGEGHNSEAVWSKSWNSEPRFSVDSCPFPFKEQWNDSSNVSEVVNGTMGSTNKFESRRLSMHSIVEDESSSVASGSGHSNSGSSSFMRLSSLLRSSPVCRDDVSEKLGSVSRYTAGATENGGGLKSIGWRKVCSAFGFRAKNSEKVCETLGGNNAINDAWKVERSTSARNSSRFALKGIVDFKVERNRRGKYYSGDEITPFLPDAAVEELA